MCVAGRSISRVGLVWAEVGGTVSPVDGSTSLQSLPDPELIFKAGSALTFHSKR